MKRRRLVKERGESFAHACRGRGQLPECQPALLCNKNAPPGGSLHTRATCTLTRNAGGRLRIGNIHVTLKVNGELEEAARMKRCLDLFEDFCVVTASLREGFPIDVEVVGEAGQRLYSSSGA